MSSIKIFKIDIWSLASENTWKIYASLITNDKQTKKGKEINIFKSLPRSNVFSTKEVKGGIYLFLFSF
jgi:predicted peroxiredoxin